MDTDQQSRVKIVVLLLVCVLFSMTVAFLLSQQTQVLNRSDYLPRWYAAYRYVTESRSIYDPLNSLDVSSFNHSPSELGEQSSNDLADFNYPAHLLLIVLPFVWLPYPWAFFIWLVIVQVFSIAGIFWLAKIESWPHTPNQLAVFIMMAILFIPSIQNTIWGQFNTISVISLVLVYINLRRQHYALAGVLTLGLTFKPQAMLLTIVFFLIWSLSDRRRWSYALSFGLTGVAAWAFAELIEPGWIASFLEAVRVYNAMNHPMGVLAFLGPGGTVLSFILLSIALLLFVWNRSYLANSIPFAGSLVLSLSIWWMIVPIIGMMNLVVLPLALIWLFSNLEKTRPALYRFALVFYFVLYFLGLAGFIYGLTRPELYGLHIQLSDLAYNVVAPIMTTILAIPLCFASRTLPNINLFRRKEAL